MNAGVLEPVSGVGSGVCATAADATHRDSAADDKRTRSRISVGLFVGETRLELLDARFELRDALLERRQAAKDRRRFQPVTVGDGRIARHERAGVDGVWN